jgi:tetratricopeptide (TPR) repeat protein
VDENPRLEALRRRVEQDPASIAFAQLAEEYRRAGDFARAIECCRAGLAIHPTYASARVTLGRALVQLGRLDEARKELEGVLAGAPDNVAAVRALEEIQPTFKVVQAPPGDSTESTEIGRAQRTIAALEEWLTAIHAARASRRA